MFDYFVNNNANYGGYYKTSIATDYGQKFKNDFSAFQGKRLDLKAGMAAIAEYELGLSKLLFKGL